MTTTEAPSQPIDIHPAVSAFLGRTQKILIDGAWRDASAGTFTCENPATASVLSTVGKGATQDIDLAVDAARRAFDDGPWATMLPQQRASSRAK